MDEKSLRAMLEGVIPALPPTEPVVAGALRNGLRIRRRRRMVAAISCAAVAGIVAGAVPVLAGHTASPPPLTRTSASASPLGLAPTEAATRTASPSPGTKKNHAHHGKTSPGKAKPGSPTGTSSTLYVIGTDAGGGYVQPVDAATGKTAQPIGGVYAPTAIAITPDGKTAYVLNQESVTPVSTATGTAGPMITVGNHPVAMALTPDGKTLYVINQGSDTVTPVNTATNTAGAPIKVGDYPDAIAITPNGLLAYVANGRSDSVTPILISTNAPGPSIAVGKFPTAIAITPDSKTVYVNNYLSESTTAISTDTNAATPVGMLGHPSAIAISPTTGAAWIYNTPNSLVSITPSASNSSLSPISITGDAMQPDVVAVTPDGKTVYASTSNGLVAVDTSTNAQSSVISLGGQLRAVTYSPDGKTAYACNQQTSTLTPIDVATNQTGTPIQLPGPCDALQFTP